MKKFLLIGMLSTCAIASDYYLGLDLDCSRLKSEKDEASFWSGKMEPTFALNVGYNITNDIALEFGFKGNNYYKLTDNDLEFNLEEETVDLKVISFKAEKFYDEIEDFNKEDLKTLYAKEISVSNSSMYFKSKFYYQSSATLAFFASANLSLLNTKISTGKIYYSEENLTDNLKSLMDNDAVNDAEELPIDVNQKDLVPGVGFGFTKEITSSLSLTSSFDIGLYGPEVKNKNEDADDEIESIKLPAPYGFRIGFQYKI